MGGIRRARRVGSRSPPWIRDYQPWDRDQRFLSNQGSGCTIHEICQAFAIKDQKYGYKRGISDELKNNLVTCNPVVMKQLKLVESYRLIITESLDSSGNDAKACHLQLMRDEMLNCIVRALLFYSSPTQPSSSKHPVTEALNKVNRLMNVKVQLRLSERVYILPRKLLNIPKRNAI